MFASDAEVHGSHDESVSTGLNRVFFFLKKENHLEHSARSFRSFMRTATYFNHIQRCSREIHATDKYMISGGKSILRHYSSSIHSQVSSFPHI